MHTFLGESAAAWPSLEAKPAQSFWLSLSHCVHNIHILLSGKLCENSLSRGDPLLFNPLIHLHPLHFSSQS
jgi:hypothetical protein